MRWRANSLEKRVGGHCAGNASRSTAARELPVPTETGYVVALRLGPGESFYERELLQAGRNPAENASANC